MNVQPIFRNMTIVKEFRGEEIFKLPYKRVIPLVININSKSKEDRAILIKWEEHFQQNLPLAGLPAPYVITQDAKGIKILWKERRA